MIAKPSLTPLLRRARLQDGESLPSLLVRLQDLNFYDRSIYLRQICIEGIQLPKHSRYPERLPAHSEVYARLSVLTQTPAIDLYRATIHRFADVLTPPDTQASVIQLPTGEIVSLTTPDYRRRYLRSEQRAAWCPYCLKEAAYHRLIWTPFEVAACLEHDCLLLTACPICASPVSIPGVVQAQCERCQAELHTTQAISLELADVLGRQTQEVIQGWLWGKPCDESHLGLPNAPSNVLHRVLNGLHSSLTQVPVSWAYLHPILLNTTATILHTRQNASPLYSYGLYATAFKALLDWPHGFYAFLSAYQERYRLTSGGNILTNLGAIYSNWLEQNWQHPAFQFIQDVFDQYLIDHFTEAPSIVQSSRYQQNPELAERFIYTTIAEAARLLHVGADTIKQLVGNGQLVAATGNQNRLLPYQLVRRAEVLALRRRWSETISLDEAAQFLGLSSAVTLDLVEIGLLEPERAPRIDLSNQWRFHYSSVNTCLERIIKHVTTEKSSIQRFVALGTASRMLNVIGFKAAHILAYVAEGKLNAYANASGTSLLSTIQFSETSLRNLVHGERQQRGWMTITEVLSCLNVKRITLARWEQSGWLISILRIGQTQYFEREAVNAFTARYIPSRTAASLLGVSMLTVQTWVRQGRLIPMSGPEIDGCHFYRFDREVILAWRHERLTFGEALELLGVSKATLHRWVEQGKFTPMEDMGGKQRWFARIEVEQLARREC